MPALASLGKNVLWEAEVAFIFLFFIFKKEREEERGKQIFFFLSLARSMRRSLTSIYPHCSVGVHFGAVLLEEVGAVCTTHFSACGWVLGNVKTGQMPMLVLPA